MVKYDSNLSNKKGNLSKKLIVCLITIGKTAREKIIMNPKKKVNTAIELRFLLSFFPWIRFTRGLSKYAIKAPKKNGSNILE